MAEHIILNVLQEEKNKRRFYIAIHELIRLCNLPIKEFKTAFWDLVDKNMLNLARSNNMYFWAVSDKEWNREDPPGEKFYAYRHGIKEADRDNMIKLCEDREIISYWVDTSIFKHSVRT